MSLTDEDGPVTESVAIVGSRVYSDRNAVRDTVHGLAPYTTVISGGAIGVDSWAADEVRAVNESLGAGEHLRLVEFLPDYTLHGKAAPFIRNSQIVLMCDRVIAHWDGASRGTLDTITKAVKAGKPVAIVPDRPRVK